MLSVALADSQYLYDENGNRIQKKQLGGDTLYHFELLNQLVKAEYPSYREELFYDKTGNRTRRVADGVEELYRYDMRNRLVSLTRAGYFKSGEELPEHLRSQEEVKSGTC